jgi:adenylosuccinate synthase
VTKAYCTRVGSGPFPSELTDAEGERIRIAGNEFGSTTGRPRRCGWLDIPQLKYATMITGTTQIAITKLDVLNAFETISVAEQYETRSGLTDQLPFDITEGILGVAHSQHAGWMQDINTDTYDGLPEAVKQYLRYLENQLGLPVVYVSTGPGREELIVR